MKNQPFSLSKRIRSFGYAFCGIKTLFKEEHNAWLHVLATGAVITLGIIFSVSAIEWIALVFAIGFVFAMEIVNTSIENIADFISPQQHPGIRKIKDLAAAAVLFASITALIVGCIVFIPKFMNL